jgi:hypothetical protein
MSITINILKTASADNEEFYTQLKSSTIEVRELPDVFICTPLPGKLLHLISLLRDKHVPYEINPRVVY